MNLCDTWPLSGNFSAYWGFSEHGHRVPLQKDHCNHRSSVNRIFTDIDLAVNIWAVVEFKEMFKWHYWITVVINSLQVVPLDCWAMKTTVSLCLHEDLLKAILTTMCPSEKTEGDLVLFSHGIISCCCCWWVSGWGGVVKQILILFLIYGVCFLCSDAFIYRRLIGADNY